MTNQNLCKCGCGELVSLSRITNKNKGLIAGQSFNKFVYNHHIRKNKLFFQKKKEFDEERSLNAKIKNGFKLLFSNHYCKCGCGRKTSGYTTKNKIREYIKGHHTIKNRKLYEKKLFILNEIKHKINYCKCGCGQIINLKQHCFKNSLYVPQYICGHDGILNKGKKIDVSKYPNYGMKGKKHSEKSKILMRNYSLQRKFPFYDTNIEIMMKQELEKRGLMQYFKQHKPIFKQWQADFISEKFRIIIECDGDYWHANPKLYDKANLNFIQQKRVKRDEKINDYINNNTNYLLLRFWENNIKKDIEYIGSFIQNCCNERENLLLGV